MANKIKELQKKQHAIEEFIENNNLKKIGFIKYLKSSNMLFRYYFNNSEIPKNYEQGCLEYLEVLRNNIDKFLVDYRT